MKIYTYYEDISFNLQNELLDIWGKSWRRYNFEPVLLSRDDAKKSCLFQEYYDFIQRIHEQVCGKQLQDKSYCMAAQLEIVAFHTIIEPSYISDYDMINNGFYTGENLESLVHWRNDACSCFASGDKYGWEKYIKFLFDKEQIIIDWCKQEYSITGKTNFHDQDFLIAVRQLGIDNQIYKMSRNLNVLGSDYIPDEVNTCKIPHLSHNNMGKIQKLYAQYANMSQDKIRLIMAKEILERT